MMLCTCATLRPWDSGTVGAAGKRDWGCMTMAVWNCCAVGLWHCGTVGLWGHWVIGP